MKKLRIFLIVIMFIIVPSIVLAKGGGSKGLTVSSAIRNGSLCINTYVNICIKSIGKNDFKRKF